MNSSLSYNGIVTIVTKMGDKIVNKRYHNNGTTLLFELYARALAGQGVSRILPSYIDFGTVQSDGTTYESGIKNSAPVIVTYVDKVNGAAAEYPYNKVPVTRVEAIVTKNMFEVGKLSGLNTVQLRTHDGRVLAQVSVANIGASIQTIPAGAQMIVVWDLYVDNNSSTDGGN